MALRAGFQIVAQKLQEAAVMSHGDIESRLRDTLCDAFRGTGTWAYVVAIFGDDKAGDVIYSADDDLMRAPYTCSTSGATIDTSKAVEVVPLTTYELETGDVMATEAGARNSKRDMSQLQAIHDAAKNLGAACGMKEAAAAAADLKLIESIGAEFLTSIQLSEAARTSYPIKLISPGTGSTAHYPAAVLEAAAGKFGVGTLMFWNHPTMAEESARPEGNLDHLAAIITSAARWEPNGAKGPGLYAEAKVMADYAQKVEERAPHIGLSIRAGGKGTGRLVEGKPELASIDYVESVDYVTKAGRGGLALAEAARDAGILEGGESDMDTAEVQRIVEAAVKTAVAQATAPLQERARRGDATVIAHRALASIGFSEAQKAFVVETVLRETIPTKDGAVDADALGVLVTTEAKRLGTVLGGNVRGFNAGTELQIDPVKLAESRTKARAEEKESLDEFAGIFQELGLSEAASKKAAEGRTN
jgi:hypothetical protein